MIKITSAQQAERLRGVVPEVVITKMKQFEGDDDVYDPDIFGYLIWLEKSDDLSQIPEVGENGLLGILNDEWQGFEVIDLHVNWGRIIYEMVVAIDADKVIVIFVEDAPWLDPRLKSALNTEFARTL